MRSGALEPLVNVSASSDQRGSGVVPTKQRGACSVELRVQSFAISIDGYGAGPNQDLEHPLGVRGPELMEWFFHTHMWRKGA